MTTTQLALEDFLHALRACALDTGRIGGAFLGQGRISVSRRSINQAGSCCYTEVCCRSCKRCSSPLQGQTGILVKDKRDKQQKDKRLILTKEDLSKALHECGVNVKHPEYFVDSPSAGLDPASEDE